MKERVHFSWECQPLAVKLCAIVALAVPGVVLRCKCVLVHVWTVER